VFMNRFVPVKARQSVSLFVEYHLVAKKQDCNLPGSFAATNSSIKEVVLCQSNTAYRYIQVSISLCFDNKVF
jgi:hypothetical protein